VRSLTVAIHHRYCIIDVTRSKQNNS
jgi:hypothetical protein